jgi:hypothetical protein
LQVPVEVLLYLLLSSILNNKIRRLKQAPYITALKGRVFRRLEIKPKILLSIACLLEQVLP